MTMIQGPDFTFEQSAWDAGARAVVGLDEVGRGPLAGPVVAAAVILNPERLPDGLNDSKKLSNTKRESLFDLLQAHHLLGVGEVSPGEIDTLNIHKASLLAMIRAVSALPSPPDFALVDGKFLPPDLPCAGEAIIKGDGRSLSIAAASVIAKVTRDRLMRQLDAAYPGYGWVRNMGYPTSEHRAALKSLGVTPHHRKSFKPVHNIL